MSDVRWGFLGAGFVASRGVAPVVHQARNAVLQVVGARDVARARALEPVRAVATYDEVLAADDVDAVYISLPNSDHLPWVVAALDAGKHVLCEKPLALDAEQVADMTAASERNGVHLVEASWNRWHPRTRRAQDIVSQVTGEFDIRTWFTFSGVPDDNYRLDPRRGGGALLDVGVYAIAAAMMGLGPDVTVVDATRDLGATGVDLTTTATLASGRGRASVLGSFVQPESQGWTMSAPGLTVEVPHPAFTSWRETSSLHVVEDGIERDESFEPCDAYGLMVEAVSARILGEDAWCLPLSTSLAVAGVVDEVARLSAAS